MLKPDKLSALYDEAFELTTNTPEIGRTLVGNCTTVHYGMLHRARQLFGASVQFTLGSVEIGGQRHFDFTQAEFDAWVAGVTKPTYNLHAWLALPDFNDELIDLTLAATLPRLSSAVLPSSTTYLTRRTAEAYGIRHDPSHFGDDLLFRLRLVRGFRV